MEVQEVGRQLADWIDLTEDRDTYKRGNEPSGSKK